MKKEIGFILFCATTIAFGGEVPFWTFLNVVSQNEAHFVNSADCRFVTEQRNYEGKTGIVIAVRGRSENEYAVLEVPPTVKVFLDWDQQGPGSSMQKYIVEGKGEIYFFSNETIGRAVTVRDLINFKTETCEIGPQRD